MHQEHQQIIIIHPYYNTYVSSNESSVTESLYVMSSSNASSPLRIPESSDCSKNISLQQSCCSNDDPKTFENTYNSMQSKQTYDLATWRMHDRITMARMYRDHMRSGNRSTARHHNHPQTTSSSITSARSYQLNEMQSANNSYNNEDDEIFEIDM